MLEWLKWSVEDQENSLMEAFYLLVLGEILFFVSLAYIALKPDQQSQFLAVFSKGGGMKLSDELDKLWTIE